MMFADMLWVSYFFSHFFCLIVYLLPGYKDAFLQLTALVGSMIQFGEKADIVFSDTKTFLETSLEQLGDATRLIGSASQALKALREKEYLQKTDRRPPCGVLLLPVEAG